MLSCIYYKNKKKYIIQIHSSLPPFFKKQNKTKQNKTKQNKTKQNKTKQNKTKQNKTEKPAHRINR